jgi:hypothetical protein
MFAAKDRPPHDAAASSRPVTLATPTRTGGNLRQESRIRPFMIAVAGRFAVASLLRRSEPLAKTSVFNKLRTLLPAQKLQPAYFQSPTQSLTHTKNITAAFPVTSALFIRSFAQERKSTPLFSSAYARFCRKWGYLQNSVRILTVNILYYLDSLPSPLGAACTFSPPKTGCGLYWQPTQTAVWAVLAAHAKSDPHQHLIRT